MDESILDGILAELSKNGTNSMEATDEILSKLNVTSVRSDEISFLINQGYIQREFTPQYEHPRGVWNSARYYINLTPQGLKFISEGGYGAKSGYVNKTLKVATQSRNWAIVGVGIALIALGSQVYYGSYNNSASKSGDRQPNVILSKDTIKNGRDTIAADSTSPDSAIKK